MSDERNEVPAVWASWITMVMGVWLIISPWVIGFADRPVALWNTLILGVLVLLAAIYTRRTPAAGPSLWNVVMGVWLILSPLFLGYSDTGIVLINDVVPGIVVAVLGLAASMEKAATGRRTAA
jgi:FtsH-binding integral membrane protein